MPRTDERGFVAAWLAISGALLTCVGLLNWMANPFDGPIASPWPALDETRAVAFHEQIAGHPKVDLVTKHRAGLDQAGVDAAAGKLDLQAARQALKGIF